MPTSMNTGRLLSAKGTSMRFRGKWSENSEYQNSQEYIDLTESDGSLWICEKTNSGVKPVEGEYWALAAKGMSEEIVNSIDTLTNDINSLKASVNGKAEANHNHSTNDITSGTLPIARGGTGATSAASARNSLGLGTAILGVDGYITKIGYTQDATGSYIEFTANNGSKYRCAIK